MSFIFVCWVQLSSDGFLETCCGKLVKGPFVVLRKELFKELFAVESSVV